MSISTAKQFVAVLAKSRLLKPKHLDAVRSAAANDPAPKALAGRLVRKELLSRWQAKQLLAGHASFFLGEYRLIEPLGSHPGSHVYLTEHETLGRRVVLKRLPRDAMEDADRKKRLLDAAGAAVGLEHENLARVYSIEQARERYYVISQYVEGRDLAATVAETGPLGFADIAGAISQAAAGLAEAHRHDVVHGGVRPSNLVIGPEGQVKLVAVATARRHRNDEAGADDTPARLDAVNYQAPELAKPDAEPTPASDIYSLGCTLYFLLTGNPPFAEGTAAERAAAHARHQPQGILRTRPDTPDSLLKACRKMLAKRPEDRPGSAEETVGLLEELTPKRSGARIVATVSARRPEGKPRTGQKEQQAAAGEKDATKEVEATAGGPARSGAAAPEPEGKAEALPTAAPLDESETKERASEPAPKDRRPPADAKSAGPRQPAKAAPAAAKPAPRREPARGAASQGAVGDQPSARKAPATQPEAALAIDTGGADSPVARAQSRGGTGRPRLEDAKPAAAIGSPQGFPRRHAKWLLIGGGSVAVLLLAGAIVLVLGGFGGDRPSPDKTEVARAEQPQPQPQRSKSDDVPDELDLESELDLDMDLGIDRLPGRRPSDPEPDDEAAEPDEGEEPGPAEGEEPATEEQPPAEGEDAEPADPGQPEPDSEEGDAEPAEPQQPEEKPEPPKKEKPPTFQDFPEIAELPPLEAEEGQPPPFEPVTLGKLYVRERAPWIVTLRGGDAVVPNAELALRRDEAEGGGRAYVVERRPATGETAAVARFFYEPQSDELKFRWLEAAAELAGAGLLRLCLLELNIDGETKTLAFSKPRPAPPLEFDLDQRNQTVTIECDALPDSKLLRLEFTEIEGPVKHYYAQPDGPVEARKVVNLAFQRTDRHKNLQGTAAIQIRFSSSGKRVTVTRQIQYPKGRLAQPGPPLQMMRDKLAEQHKKAEAAMKQAGHRTQSEAIFQKQVAPIEHMLAHLDLIEQVDKQAKIHYRILLDSGSHQVPLFDSRIAEAP